MTSLSNPFIINGKIPTEYFCDRVDESASLIKLLLNGNNVVLTSPRRIGKTGLVEHCFQQSELNEKYHTIFVDILGTSNLREFTYVFGQQIFEALKTKSQKLIDLFFNTVRSISGEFGYDVITGLPKFNISLGAIENPQHTLNEIFTYIDKADRRCIIAIDEFQQIVNYPEKNIEAILRTHIQHCSNANFIFAGSERHILAEMFNSYSRPFYASTSPLNLDELKLDKYSEFVTRLFEKFGKTIDSQIIEYVYGLFDGNTYCMQKTFNATFSATETECSMQIAEDSIANILLENERNYQSRLALLPPKPKELLIAIAKDGVAQRLTSGEFIRRHKLSSASSVQSATNQLLANDWITYSITDGYKKFFLTDKFMTLWLKDQFGQGWR